MGSRRLDRCATDHFRWDNVLPPGTSHEFGLPVRRFPAIVDTPGRERADWERTILSGEPVPIHGQERWMNDGVRVPALFHHLLDHGTEYDAILLGPYLLWSTFACAQIHPDRTVLWACLHDEPYLHLDLFQPMLSGVAGLLLLSDAEHDLAHSAVPFLAPHEVGRWRSGGPDVLLGRPFPQ